MLTASKIIEIFKMTPHPEGGYYTETYRSPQLLSQQALPSCYSGPRSLSTAILYLLTSKSVSKLHRLKSDEMFHFYLGKPAFLLLLFPDTTSKIVTLGPDILNGQLPQLLVLQGTWMGSFVIPPGRFALLGTTVSPGFDFADFEPADRQKLIANYPNHKDLITKLT